MCNRHFKSAVTRGAKGYQVLHDVCYILILIISAWVNVMNVKSATAWAMARTAVLADLIAGKDFCANVFPKAPMLQTSAAAPVCAILSHHVFAGALYRTKTALVFNTVENSKLLTAVFAILERCCYLACVRAFERAMSNGRSLLIERLTALFARDVFHLSATIESLTGGATKNIDRLFVGTGWRALKGLAAIRAGESNGFTQGIYRAFTRTMIDCPIVCFEFCSALEA